MNQVNYKLKRSEFCSSDDNNISHAERRVTQAKGLLREYRSMRHNIINGRKLDPAEIDQKIRNMEELLESHRRQLAEMYVQKFNLQTNYL
jgi:hypothetical protein